MNGLSRQRAPVHVNIGDVLIVHDSEISTNVKAQVHLRVLHIRLTRRGFGLSQAALESKATIVCELLDVRKDELAITVHANERVLDSITVEAKELPAPPKALPEGKKKRKRKDKKANELG